MPHPTLTTTWPNGDSLREWLTENSVSVQTDTELIDDLVADASASIYETIDPGKLPEDTDECPRTLARAIVLEAARLLYRRQSPHGMASFGEIGLRLRSADVDVDRLVQPYRLDPEP